MGIVPHAFDQVLKVIERVNTQIAALIRCGRPDWSEQDWHEFEYIIPYLTVVPVAPVSPTQTNHYQEEIQRQVV